MLDTELLAVRGKILCPSKRIDYKILNGKENEVSLVEVR